MSTKPTAAQEAALQVVGQATKVWRSQNENGSWQVDGFSNLNGCLDPRPIDGLVAKGFCEIVDGHDPDPNASWHDYHTNKVVLTDKGEAFLAGVLLN